MNHLKFTLWDVEHGISIWIQTPKGHSHWIDLGKTADFSPTKWVADKHDISDGDYLIISHPDKDHIEDLPNFIDSFGKPRILLRNKSLPAIEFYGSCEAEYQRQMKDLHERYIHPVGKSVAPTNPDYNGGVEYFSCHLDHGRFQDGTILEGNNASIVVLLSYNGILFICPGDIEPKGWDALWAKNSERITEILQQAKIRLLVAPHHGRESGYSDNMMDALKPDAVFISDKWGDSTTHSHYYAKPLGVIMPDGTTKRCFSTKTKGRILCEVDDNGSLSIEQFDPDKAADLFSALGRLSTESPLERFLRELKDE